MTERNFAWKLDPELQKFVEIPPATDLDADVPCGKCRLCCQGYSAVMLLEDHGDPVDAYDSMTLPGMPPEARFLKFKDNGDCIYLTKEGCGIHGHAPFMCRTFDCRAQHQMHDKRMREHLVKKGMLKADVLRRGAILIHQEQKGRK